MPIEVMAVRHGAAGRRR